MARTSNIVSLTAHRNTRERRRRRDLRKEMIAAARQMSDAPDIKGYVLVGIGANGAAYCLWDTGQAIPLWSLPGFVHEVVSVEARGFDLPDDFDPERVS